MSQAPYLREDRPSPEPIRLSAANLFPDLDGTYRAMAALTRRDPARWRAWKLGGTNSGSRAAFKVDELYYGAIDQDEILDQPERAPDVRLAECKGEVEIALRVAPDGESWDAWAVSLEMPASPIRDIVNLGVRALVADRCAAGALVLGPVQDAPLPDRSAELSQDVNGTRISVGRIGDLSDAPEILFAQFIALARHHDAPVSPGDWVATGGVTACINYDEGDSVTISLNDRPHLSLTIATGI